MIETAMLAGYWTAHGIWSAPQGGVLTPMLGHDQPDGGRHLVRLAHDDLGDGVRTGQEWLAANHFGAVRAALVVDAYVTLATGRTDALVTTAVRYGPRPAKITMAVPYRAASSPAGFAVHRPKLLVADGADSPGDAAVCEAFFAGAETHPEAMAVWDAHLDESV